MEKIEWDMLRKECHATIKAAIEDFDRLGYLISAIRYINGALEIKCCPPNMKDSGYSSTGNI